MHALCSEIPLVVHFSDGAVILSGNIHQVPISMPNLLPVISIGAFHFLAVLQIRITSYWFKDRELTFALGSAQAFSRLGSVLNFFITENFARKYGLPWTLWGGRSSDFQTNGQKTLAPGSVIFSIMVCSYSFKTKFLCKMMFKMSIYRHIEIYIYRHIEIYGISHPTIQSWFVDTEEFVMEPCVINCMDLIE